MEWEGSLKLVRPVWELEFLPILQPFRHCSRTMFKAGTFAEAVLKGTIPISIKLIKGTKHDISNLLYLVEDGEIFRSLSETRFG
jgi:hypothetical protein